MLSAKEKKPQKGKGLQTIVMGWWGSHFRQAVREGLSEVGTLNKDQENTRKLIMSVPRRRAYK